MKQHPHQYATMYNNMQLQQQQQPRFSQPIMYPGALPTNQAPWPVAEQQHQLMNVMGQSPMSKMTQLGASNSSTPPMVPTATAQLATRAPVVPAVNNPMVPHIESICADTETRKKNLSIFQHRDQLYQEALNTQHKRHIALAQEKKREIDWIQHQRQTRVRAGPILVFGPGYTASGSQTTGLETRVLYPNQRKRLRASRELRFRHDQLVEQGEKDDTLVPIRLELEVDGYKLRDTFTWNMNETLITPEQFAEIMCEDLQLPPSTFVPLISRGIRDQLEDYYLNAGSAVMDGDGSDAEKETAEFLAQCNDSSQYVVKVEKEEDLERRKRKHTELRMLIKLDITVGKRALLDQFEWDIACQRNDAEEFADKLTKELGLGSEFRTAIAHSIREQAHSYIKSLLLVGYEFDGSPISDDELRQSFLPSLKSIIRDLDSVERFTPAILELTDAELDKIEKDRMRDARRKRRQARGRRGVVLPDREPQKTFRTGIAVAPEQDVSDEQFLMDVGMVNGVHTRGSTPTSNFEPMHSQRKSALRARMNIAADAASSHHTSASPPPFRGQYGSGVQGVIPLNTGSRFSMMDQRSFSGQRI
ncbi:SNF5-domain-containing protein [Lichtheimia hyalospora FSU 10163]|nr:SNF5-domain-containing protein [Lichtheimia hyalospora FSU 10163]